MHCSIQLTEKKESKEMAWSNSGGGSDFAQPDAGSHNAVCYRIIDIGTQSSMYEGKETHRRQNIIQWEIEDTMEDGRRFSVSAFVTASLNEKAKLRQWMTSWRGRDFTDEELAKFDPANIIGAPCMLTIAHNEKGRANVVGVSKLPKGMTPLKPENESFYFSLEHGEYNVKLMDKISDGLKKFILQSPEYAQRSSEMLKGGDVPGSDSDDIQNIEDDLPFN